MRKKLWGAIAFAGALMTSVSAMAWTLEEAAQPYKGTNIKAIFLDRPGYRGGDQAAARVREEDRHQGQLRDRPLREQPREGSPELHRRRRARRSPWSTSSGSASSPRTAGSSRSRNSPDDAKLTDPEPQSEGLLPAPAGLPSAPGAAKIYGLPFDNYSGLLFYNKCMLKEAGFDKPPATWDELMNVYAPKLTDAGQEASTPIALQSLRGETQSADSFMRFLWPFGGSLLDESSSRT